MIRMERFPIICEHCGEGFDTVVVGRHDVDTDDVHYLLPHLYPTLTSSGGEVRPECPRCEKRQSRWHYIDWKVWADAEGWGYHDSSVIFFCPTCRRLQKYEVKVRMCRSCGRFNRWRTIDKWEQAEKERCARCEKRCYDGEILTHHTSYVPERTMRVCTKCHGEIHNSLPEDHDLVPDLPRDALKLV